MTFNISITGQISNTEANSLVSALSSANGGIINLPMSLLLSLTPVVLAPPYIPTFTYLGF